MSLRKKSNGYTLWELMIVLAIMSAFAGLALCFIKDPTDRVTLKQRANKICKEILECKLKARQEGITTTVLIESAFLTCWPNGDIEYDNCLSEGDYQLIIYIDRLIMEPKMGDITNEKR